MGARTSSSANDVSDEEESAASTFARTRKVQRSAINPSERLTLPRKSRTAHRNPFSDHEPRPKLLSADECGDHPVRLYPRAVPGQSLQQSNTVASAVISRPTAVERRPSLSLSDVSDENELDAIDFARYGHSGRGGHTHSYLHSPSRHRSVVVAGSSGQSVVTTPHCVRPEETSLPATFVTSSHPIATETFACVAIRRQRPSRSKDATSLALAAPHSQTAPAPRGLSLDVPAAVTEAVADCSISAESDSRSTMVDVRLHVPNELWQNGDYGIPEGW